MSRDIYVYFACFHDSEVIPTIINIFEAADNPDNVSVGIDFQYIREDIKDEFVDWVAKNKQWKIKYMLTKYTYDNFWDIVGLAKGRIRAHSLRENEEYALLVDGHSLFAKGWDTMCLDKHDKADAINLQKPIIHGYAGYYVLDKQGRRMWLPSYMATIRYQYYVNYNENDRHQKEAKFKWHETLPTFIITKENPETEDELIPNVKFSGNFSFTRYDICQHLPTWVLFEDEEIPWSINLFDAGFSFAFPNFQTPVVGHLYMGTTEPYLTARNTRDNIEFYVPNNDVPMFLKIKDANIDAYMSAKENYRKIINYQDYAKVAILSGQTEEYYVPKNFR